MVFTFREAEALWGEDHLRALLRKGVLKRVLHGVYAEADATIPGWRTGPLCWSPRPGAS